jgi:hypothetical protein
MTDTLQEKLQEKAGCQRCPLGKEYRSRLAADPYWDTPYDFVCEYGQDKPCELLLDALDTAIGEREVETRDGYVTVREDAAMLAGEQGFSGVDFNAAPYWFIPWKDGAPVAYQDIRDVYRKYVV